ncbi:MAG: PKD domain-containing protein [Chitinophagaceae bacterium]
MTNEDIQKIEGEPGFWSQNLYKIISITLLLGGLITVAILGVKKILPDAADIKAQVWPRTFSLKEGLHYKDSSEFSTNTRWAFGDGNQSFFSNGSYQYTKPGNYIVQLTVNNKFLDTFFVTVVDTPRVINITDSVAVIDAPSIGMQFENLVFRATAIGATQFRWKFGETGGIDSKEPFVQYFYKQPGDYTVLLYTDNNQYPSRHTIKILPSYERRTDTVSIDDMYRKYEDDFKAHLQEIARGNSFNTNYYYLLKKYLCNNEKTIVKINGAKVNDFNSYCLGLQFDEGVTIQSVKLTSDETLNCMKAIEVKQVKGQ